MVVETRSLGRTYHLGDEEVHALRAAELTIQRGEFVAIMGPSGSGKSTLMNLLGCLDRPSEGRYFFEGVDVAELDDLELAAIRSERIGFVFQSFNLLARTSAVENVALPLLYAGARDRLGRARTALRLLGLGERERNYPSQLSGGQQQRVAIARALINDPAMLLADEPTGNLDTRTTREIMTTIRALNRERGVTVIVVTHEREVAAYADRVIAMRDGEIVSDERQVAIPVEASDEVESEEEAPSGSARSAGMSLGVMVIATAAHSLARNKLRSALTMLGVFIGVAALIAMVALGEGANAAVKKQLEALGTNLLVVVPGATTAGGARAGLGSATALRVSDAEAIRHEAPSVLNVAYQLRSAGQVVSGDRNWSTSLQGITPSYLPVTNWAIAEGRNIEAGELETAAMVCLIGETVRDKLFPPGQDPVGAVILVKSNPMRVVGVLKSKGQSAFGQDQDDIVMMPFSTAERKVLGVAVPLQAPATSATLYPQAVNPFGTQPRLTGYVQTLYVQARSAELVPRAIIEVTQTLARLHRIRPPAPNDFTVRNLSEITEAAESSTRALELLLATIASISLVVGGIGIMNILLVSVTERTREIGIRMAIGARRRHVLVQFLAEAVLLSTIGGSAGIGAGIGATKLVAAVLGWPTLLSPAIIAGAFLFSAAVGVFFGFYPARKAAHLDPIEALRYE